MFDAKRLLGQLIASQVGRSLGQHGRGYDRGHGGGFGGHGGGSPLDSLARQLGGGGSGALAGGLASILLGSKKGRKLGGSAAKLGGLALIGSLAYRAYQDWQAGQGARAAGMGPGSARGGFIPQPGQSPWGQPAQAAAGLAPPPPGTPFNPAGEEEQQDLSRALLRAMIAAAKADGHIDAAEQANIFGAMDKLDLDSDDKAFVMDELRAPLDVDAVARGARNPEEAAEIYAASLLAIDVDNAAERGYLAMLAARLKLDDALVQHLHRTVEEAGRTP
ncbi:tellurite resistance TerB family protein [Enterovirga aerilata]|uniref:Tellurite resistance TerB family protein n=1 Tax=Enterovirga aerilata TaxID=2730920 RepID=A0A849I0Y5_9HYPH|nr:tellurite resistance TerB family protein [Enterovirga sp. DB1703]NNM71051.1 tellurite resistance TerB family protein [Enterovirga sp. DB1703]